MIRRLQVPTVTQVTTTECGLCAAVAVLGYYGRSEEIFEARQSLDAGRDGVRLKDIADYLTSRNMLVKAFRAKSVDALVGLTQPVILYWNEGHFIVLENFDGKTARVMDPAIGRRRLSARELEDGFVGPALWAHPDKGFERRRARPFSEWRKTKLLAGANRTRTAAVALLSLVSYFAILGLPMLTQWVIDRRDLFDSAGSVAVYAALILSLGFGYFLITLLRSRTLAVLMEHLGSEMMRNTFGKLLHLPYRFFSLRQPGELLFRLGSVNSIRDILATRVAQGVLDTGTFIVITGYLVMKDWRLAVAAFVFVFVNSIVVLASQTRLLELVDEEISQGSKSQTMQLDAVVSIPSIRLGGYEDELIDSWADTFDKAMSAMKRRMVLQSGVIGGASGVTTSFAPVVLLLLSLLFVSQGTLTLGSAIAIQMISATYFSLATSAFSTYTEFAEASRYLARINEILLTEPESEGGARRELPEPSVQLSGVDFKYSQNSPLVLRDINLDIQPGERVAIVGQSGSGKSTLARIITSLYEPSDGDLFFGGIPKLEYNQKALRSHIGFIPQETHMHNHSILENLTMGRDIPLEDVAELCAHIGILEMIQSLPMGFHTIVTEMGANFSGGQRQRFAIARTLLQEPSILILDEATASLDTVNERRINDYLRQLGATQIVIAHRLATICEADRILVMEDGQIVEQGTHDELFRQGGLYAEIYEADAIRQGQAIAV